MNTKKCEIVDKQKTNVQANLTITKESRDDIRELCRLNNISVSTLFEYLLKCSKQKELDRLSKRYKVGEK